MSDSVRPHRRQPTRLPHPWDSPGKNTGVGCQALLQADLPNPGIEPMSLMSPALAGGFFTTSTIWWRRQWHPTPVLLPGKIPWMEEPGGLQSMGLLRVRHNLATSLSLFTFIHWRRKWQPTHSVLAYRIPGTGEPGGLPSMGSHRVGHD